MRRLERLLKLSANLAITSWLIDALSNGHVHCAGHRSSVFSLHDSGGTKLEYSNGLTIPEIPEIGPTMIIPEYSKGITTATALELPGDVCLT